MELLACLAVMWEHVFCQIIEITHLSID